MNYKLAIVYGVAIWVGIFVVSMLAFPLHTNERPLFESIMPIASTIITVIFSILYFKKIEKDYIKIGTYLGVIWLMINIIIDLLMFMEGPMKMPFVDYIKDIGLTYLLIPVITIGFGYSLEKKER